MNEISSENKCKLSYVHTVCLSTGLLNEISEEISFSNPVDKQTVWLIHVQIFSVPNFKLVFACPLFPRSPALLLHNTDMIVKEKKEHAQSFFTSATPSVTPDPNVVEISVHRLDNSPFPYLMVRKFDSFSHFSQALLSNGDFLIYKSFRYDDRKSVIRFSKVEHDFITRNFSAQQAPPLPGMFYHRRIIYFDNIADRKGVFVAGLRSAFLFCEREYLRIHSMDCDGEVISFTPYSAGYNGFIYFTATVREKVVIENPMKLISISLGSQ